VTVRLNFKRVAIRNKL